MYCFSATPQIIGYRGEIPAMVLVNDSDVTGYCTIRIILYDGANDTHRDSDAETRLSFI